MGIESILVLMLVVGDQQPAIPEADISKLLGSGRTDLVFKMGGERNAIFYKKHSLPIDSLHNNGACEYRESEDSILYSGPAPWAWKMSGPNYGSLAAPSVLVRFDETSAFKPQVFGGPGSWGEGALLRFENGEFILVGEAQEFAQKTYGLKPGQKFLGLIGNNVLFWDQKFPRRVFFFDRYKYQNIFSWFFDSQKLGAKSFILKHVIAAYTLPSIDEAWLQTSWQNGKNVPMWLRWERVKFSNAKPWNLEGKALP